MSEYKRRPKEFDIPRAFSKEEEQDYSRQLREMEMRGDILIDEFGRVYRNPYNDPAYLQVKAQFREAEQACLEAFPDSELARHIREDYALEAEEKAEIAREAAIKDNNATSKTNEAKQAWLENQQHYRDMYDEHFPGTKTLMSEMLVDASTPDGETIVETKSILELDIPEKMKDIAVLRKLLGNKIDDFKEHFFNGYEYDVRIDYMIEKGDTLEKIVKKLNVEMFDKYELVDVFSVEKIAEINKIYDLNKIREGATLNVDPALYLWDKFYKIRTTKAGAWEVRMLPPNVMIDYQYTGKEAVDILQTPGSQVLNELTSGYVQRALQLKNPKAAWRDVYQTTYNAVVLNSYQKDSSNPISVEKQIDMYVNSFRVYYRQTGRFPKLQWANKNSSVK